MSINNVVVACIFGVFVCVSCLGAAAQSCPSGGLPPASACVQIFNLTLGSPVAPGTTCVCGASSGAGSSASTCYLPLCTKHNTGNCPYCSKPVSLATGNTYFTQQDIKLPGLGGGLTLARTWNSLLRPSLSSVGMFGPNWRSTYEERIYVDDDNTIAYARGDGSVWNFVVGASAAFSPTPPANTLFTYRQASPANATAALFYGSTAWTLVFLSGEQRVFDAISGNLLSITDRNGNTTQLTYDASYRLTTVTDPVSRHLYFSYAGAGSYAVTSVTSDTGISLSYSYDSQGRLAQYTKPDNTTVSFQYNASNPILVTAVLDQNGKILESHTYDNLNRGLTSSRAGGVEAVTITYPQGAIALP